MFDLSTPEDVRLAEAHKEEVDVLQKRVSELQAEHVQELKKARLAADVSNFYASLPSLQLCIFFIKY